MGVYAPDMEIKDVNEAVQNMESYIRCTQSGMQSLMNLK